MKGLCDNLIAEHELIEQVLDAIATEVRRLDKGGAVDRNFVTKAVAFVREFADGTHHHKEEEVLFPRLVAAGMPAENGPVGVMLYEHGAGRAFIRTISESVESATQGDTAARTSMMAAMSGYVDLLRAHIQKENMILFPMAERILEPGVQDQIGAAFRDADRIGDKTQIWRAWAAAQLKDRA